MGLPEEVIQSVAAAESQELAAQEQRYRGDRQPLELANRTVILVDDGIATGCSIRAAVASARQQHAARVVVAVPVAAVATCDLIAREADEVVCLAEPEEFFAISQWYEDFHQSSDEDVRSLLEEADRLTLCSD